MIFPDDDAQVDQHGLTPADHDAIVEWWRASQNHGVWYTQPPIKGRPPRGSFTISDDVVNQLGDGDPHTAGMVLHGMFGLAPATGEDDARVIDPDVVKHIGHGSLAAGQRHSIASFRWSAGNPAKASSSNIAPTSSVMAGTAGGLPGNDLALHRPARQ